MAHVPAPISYNLASLSSRPVGYSFMYPLPPSTCTRKTISQPASVFLTFTIQHHLSGHSCHALLPLKDMQTSSATCSLCHMYFGLNSAPLPKSLPI